MSITIWFDPSCPFTWRTSRLVRDVAQRRGEDVQWRFLSLAILNEDKEIPDSYREAHARATAALRVLAAAEADHGQPGVDRLYTAMGSRLHDKGDDLSEALLADALADAALPAELARAAGDGSYDEVIRRSHDAGQASVGAESGSPVTAFDGRPGFFGPVVSAVPAPGEADRLVEAMRLLSSVPVFSEAKRAREPLS